MFDWMKRNRPKGNGADPVVRTVAALARGRKWTYQAGAAAQALFQMDRAAPDHDV